MPPLLQGAIDCGAIDFLFRVIASALCFNVIDSALYHGADGWGGIQVELVPNEAEPQDDGRCAAGTGAGTVGLAD